MDRDNAFLLGNACHLILAAGTPPAAIQLSGPQQGSLLSILVYNASTTQTLLAFGPTAAAAATNATTAPAVGTPSPSSTVVPPAAYVAFSAPPGQWWTANGSGNLYIQTGDGL